MSINITSIFLMSVLVLGFASYPSALPDLGQDITNSQLPLGNVAFAQKEIKVELKEEIGISTEEEIEEETEEEEEEVTEEEEIDIEAKVKDGVVKVNVEINDEDFEFEFELIATDPDAIIEEIENEILARTELTLEQLGALQIKFEEDNETEDGMEDDKEELGILEIEDESELKVQAKIIGDQSRVKIKKEFSTLTIDRTALIDEIIAEFALTRDDADAALKLETVEDEELSERFRVKARVDNGVAEVRVELKFVLDTTNRDNILDAIVSMTQLSSDQIEGVLDFEPEDEYEEESEYEETEIEVDIKKGKAKVKVEYEGEKSRFVLLTTDEAEIISSITDLTGLGESEIREIWDFDTSYEGDEETNGMEKEAKLAAKIAKHELKAKERADEKIIKLQQKIDELDQRLQALMAKFETGEYYGTIPELEPLPTSYSILFDGSATSLDDDSVVTDVEGEIFLETQVTKTHVTKFRITGGEILVGDTFYDFVFGKARASSSGNSGEKDSMIIIGQVMDDQENIHTFKISLNSEMPLTGDFSLDPVEFEIKMSQSKIAKQWGLSASGQLSLLEA
ncbi:MAG: hypothetical protein IIA83_07975 [Thaumarchaeota archaeon]|nr:hypothetical protein [Nitrososphaerota archaeon]